LIAASEASGTQVLRVSPEKDETDLELAIDWALGQDVGSLVAIGGGGGRLDHLLGNAALVDLLAVVLDVRTWHQLRRESRLGKRATQDRLTTLVRALLPTPG